MELKEEIRQLLSNAKKDVSQLYEKIKKHPLVYFIILIVFAIGVWLLFELPQQQVSDFGINNSSTVATLENQYRATLAQIIGGIAVLLGLYFAWGNLKTSKEGQITERFTRAVDQLGNTNMQVRLGGIYALGRISNESEKDYLSIIEFLTSYVKTRSPINFFPKNGSKIEKDIQAALDIIGRRKYSFESKELSRLDLQDVFLREANLRFANLRFANLQESNLEKVNFQKADLRFVNLQNANLEKADLQGANLKGANLEGAKFGETDLKGVRFEGANLKGAHFKGAKHLSFSQLSKVYSLFNAEFDPNLQTVLENNKDTYPDIFEDKDI